MLKGMCALAEDFNDYGNYQRYTEEQEFKKLPLIKKIFSWRGFKIFLKLLGYLIIISIFAILFFRMCTSKPSDEAVKLIWTNNSYKAYKDNGDNLNIYTQNIGNPLDKDGKFAVYDFRYIPETKEVQFTIRYNISTVETLATELTKKKKELLGEEFTDNDVITSDSLPELPFLFTIRDDKGNVYTESEYVTFNKNLYTYLRITFSGVDLLTTEKNTPSSYFPSPDTDSPSFIYKGRFKAENKVSPVTYLFLDSYYKEDYTLGNSFSDTLTFYRAERGLNLYDYKKEKPQGVTEGLISASASEN